MLPAERIPTTLQNIADCALRERSEMFTRAPGSPAARLPATIDAPWRWTAATLALFQDAYRTLSAVHGPPFEADMRANTSAVPPEFPVGITSQHTEIDGAPWLATVPVGPERERVKVCFAASRLIGSMECHPDSDSGGIDKAKERLRIIGKQVENLHTTARPDRAALLRALATAGSMRLNAMPMGWRLADLRALDVDGLVEVRCWGLVNHPSGSRAGLVPAPLGDWHSPAREREQVGDWDGLALAAGREPDTAAEVRLSEKGRVEASKPAEPEAHPKHKRKARKRPMVPQERPLTPIETQTVTVVASHGGNITAAAKELRRDAKTVRENHNRAQTKLARLKGHTSRSVGTRAMPTDARGQANPRERGG